MALYQNSETYWTCPNCHNNGDYGGFTGEADVVRRSEERVVFEIEELCGADDPTDYQEIETIDRHDSDIDHINWSDYYCECCKGHFTYFEPHDIEEWREATDYGATCQDRADEAKKKIETQKAEMILLTDPDKAREIFQRVDSPKEMDKLLGCQQGSGLQHYEVYPATSQYATTPSRRLFEVARELGSCGYRTNISAPDDVDGRYTISCWNVMGPMDQELNFSSTLEHDSAHTCIKILVFQELMGQPMIERQIFILVPAINERPEGKEDPDRTVKIVCATAHELKEYEEYSGSPEEFWTGEVLDRLTFYTCELELLGQTLEVVFDMTSEGYLPLLKEAGVAV